MNQNIGHEHVRSAKLFCDIAKDIKQKGGTYYTTVLVDDYNATESILDVGAFVDFLGSKGATPDFVACESRLAPSAYEILEKSNGPEKKSSFHYSMNNKKLPCSLFIATWYLIRLGYIDAPRDLSTLGNASDFRPGKQLINILPDYYKDVEKRAQALLREGPYPDAITRIHNRYFES